MSETLKSDDIFCLRKPNVVGNSLLRTPQIETYSALESFVRSEEREASVILPVGCGKSGCITLAPFAFEARRALVIAPGLRIAKQLYDDFDPSNSGMFYSKTATLVGQPFPEPVEIRGNETNRGDLDEADVVITNIQQLQGEENRWLKSLPGDYFDLILFDEGHHSVAVTWTTLKSTFPKARIVNFSATPLRADGHLMPGETVYTYPVSKAIQKGYVKRLRALVLNPDSLRYVRQVDGEEVEVSLEEIRQLGESDPSFRRSIVTSEETLNTIVDASIRELDRIREETDDKRHKIIASALNYSHCHQIVEAYRARGRSADFVHSREAGEANDAVFKRLESHDIDVIVQVRKLGEGFDHKFLSVAAVFSIFSNLSPFVQFVGRIMRVVKQKAPGDLNNQGTVVFHAGSNVASRWGDFQEFSEADQEYFDELLPVEGLDFSDGDEISRLPGGCATDAEIEVREQSMVRVEEIPLIQDDPEAMEAIRVLQGKGFDGQDILRAMELQPIPTTKANRRKAARQKLADRVPTDVGKILSKHGVSKHGKTLDKSFRRNNFVYLKSMIDRSINELVGKGSSERHSFTKVELDEIEEKYKSLIARVEKEVFGA